MDNQEEGEILTKEGVSVEKGVPMEEGDYEPIHPCAVCHAKATFVCTACYGEHYCSRVHQKNHWRAHRTSCCAYRVEDVGDTKPPSVWMDCTKYVVATRNIKPGEIILDETPLLPLPWTPIPVLKEHKWVVCLACGAAMEDPFIPEDVKRPNNYRCSTCAWPVCNEECEKNPLHADNECVVFTANGVIYPPSKGSWDTSLYGLYQNQETHARATAYRYHDPALFNRIMQIPMWGGMKYPSVEVEWNPEDPEEQTTGPSTSAPEGDYPMIGPNLDLLFWNDFRALCQNIGFHLHVTEDNVDETKKSVIQDTSHYRLAYNIYEKANMFTHSCSPNCDWMIGQPPDFKIRITAGVPIAKGEVLTINRMLYFTEGPPPVGYNRQALFQSRFEFPCKCKLCTDPTEGGTYQVAVGCSTCRPFTGNVVLPKEENAGYYLAVDPISLNYDTDWKCNLCGMVIHKLHIQPQLNLVEQVLQVARWKLTRCDVGVSTCRGIIQTFRGSFFHPNHWLMIRAMQAIILPKNRFNDFVLSPMSELYEMLDGVELSIRLWDQAVPCMSFEKANLMRSFLFTSEVINGTLIRENVMGLRYPTAPKSLEARRSNLTAVRNSQTKCLGFYKRIRCYYKSALPSPGVDYCKFAVVVNSITRSYRGKISATETYISELRDEIPEPDDEQPGTSRGTH